MMVRFGSETICSTTRENGGRNDRNCAAHIMRDPEISCRFNPPLLRLLFDRDYININGAAPLDQIVDE